MASRTLPDPGETAGLLGDLLDRKVEIVPGEAALDLQGGPIVVALYQNDSGETEGAMACSLSAAAGLGAALSMVPPARVEEQIASGQLDEAFVENFHEVCNIMVRLWNPSSLPTLTLGGVFPVPPRAPADYSDAVETLKQRADLELTIAGYPGGPVVLLAP